MNEREDEVEREVRAEDPDLSPEANRLLTEELREAVGTDRVQVPAERTDSVGRVPGTGHSTLVGTLATNRLLVIISFVILLVVGVIIALATGNWWAVVAACGVHAAGTLIVGTIVLRATTQVEHLDPATAARLEEEGVADPDRALSDLIEHYEAGGDARGAAEVVSEGHNRVSAEPEDDPASAEVEQETAQTPAGSPVEPAGPRGAPALLPILAVAGSVVVGVVVALLLGGIAWVAAALLVASSLGWLLLQRTMAGAADDRHDGGGGPDREPGDTRKGQRRRLVPTMAVVVGAVVAGVILVGRLAGYL
jgi:hypothetical protein